MSLYSLDDKILLKFENELWSQVSPLITICFECDRIYRDKFSLATGKIVHERLYSEVCWMHRCIDAAPSLIKFAQSQNAAFVKSF